MSGIFAGERDFDLIEAVEYGHLIDETMVNHNEVKMIDPGLIEIKTELTFFSGFFTKFRDCIF